MYKWIQSIQVICCTLFLFASYTNSLQLVTGDVFKARVHVFIYGHTYS